jgi:GntR family transcriptional regulator
VRGGGCRLLRFGNERYSKRIREQTGLSPYRAEVQKQGRVARVDCTSIERVQPPEDVAEKLGVDPDSKSVVRRENWYYADDEPMQVGVTFIPWEIAVGSVLAASANMGPGSLYARFEERGRRHGQDVDAGGARWLGIPDGVPVIEVVHTGTDQDGRSFEVTKFVMRADYNGLDYTMPVED